MLPVGLLLLGLCMLLPAAAAAQDADPETVAQFARLIRWSGVVTSLLVVGCAFVALRFLRKAVDDLSSRFAQRRMMLQKFATFVQFFVYIGTATTVTMLSVRLDEKVLALLGGTIAVSVGFAVKDLVASFIAGIMIMIDRPFQVGDRVAFGGEYGDITAIGLRSVRMQTTDDNTVTIPNNKFLSDMTSCGNYGALDMQVVMDFYVGVDTDVVVARDIVTEAALTSRYVYMPKPVVVLVTQVLHDPFVTMRLRLKAYVLDTRYESAFSSDVHLRVHQAFRARGILPPAELHRTVPSYVPVAG